MIKSESVIEYLVEEARWDNWAIYLVSLIMMATIAIVPCYFVIREIGGGRAEETEERVLRHKVRGIVIPPHNLDQQTLKAA